MSGPTTDTAGQIVKRPKTAADNLQSLIERMRPEMARALPRHVTPDRMARIVLTAVRTNPKLAECSPSSFLGCVMSLAQLGLEPNTPLGFAYLIPRNMMNKAAGRKEMQCTLIIGYQGMMDLARRSRLVKSIYAHAVRQGDDFSYTLGTDPKVHHVPSDEGDREAKPITHVYAVAEMEHGARTFVVMTAAQVTARRNRSMAKNEGPWITDPEKMTLKTAVRELFTWIPKSAEIALAEALEAASDTGRPILSVADETVTALLGSHGLTDDGATSEASEVENGQAATADAAEDGKEPVNEIAEVDRLAAKMNLTGSERNALVLKHDGDFKSVLAELRENETDEA